VKKKKKKESAATNGVATPSIEKKARVPCGFMR